MNKIILALVNFDDTVQKLIHHPNDLLKVVGVWSLVSMATIQVLKIFLSVDSVL